MLEGISEEDHKRYMHHYNMPGYSVGEAKASRSPAEASESGEGTSTHETGSELPSARPEAGRGMSSVEAVYG